MGGCNGPAEVENGKYYKQSPESRRGICKRSRSAARLSAIWRRYQSREPDRQESSLTRDGACVTQQAFLYVRRHRHSRSYSSRSVSLCLPPSVTLPLPLYVHVAHGARIRVSCISSALIRRGYCPAPPPVRDAVWDRLPICPRRGKVRCEPPLCSGSGENTGGLLCVCVCVCAR